MNKTQKQHALGIGLLELLGLDYVRIEQLADGHFQFVAWSTPLVGGNGSMKKPKRGTLKLKV